MDGDRDRRPRKLRVVVVALVLAGAAGWALFSAGPRPAVRLEPGRPAIGRATPVRAIFEEPSRGLGLLRVELIQGDRVELLAERRHEPRPPWRIWGPRTPSETIDIVVGTETVSGLRAGEATIQATAWPAGAPLRRPAPVIDRAVLPVRLSPPSLEVVSRGHYPSPGGAGVVVYRVGETAVRDGVEAAGWWFPGRPLPGGGAAERFALYGVPFDIAAGDELRLLAEDDAGNPAESRFVDRWVERPYRSSRIELDDAFLAKVVPEIMSRTPQLDDRGGLLENYLQINRDLRAANAETLTELADASTEAFLWRRPFLPLRGSQVMSSFADRRTYVYQDREVDHQDHLGFDLASVRRAEIPAANDGRVVLARYLGIYGNAVVIDHGFGLLSLYGHLSSIAVAEGQSVERGEVIGRSGETGLAGGDHLHFTLLLGGLAVNPVEWWDGGWIRDRIASKLGAALDFEP